MAAEQYVHLASPMSVQLEAFDHRHRNYRCHLLGIGYRFLLNLSFSSLDHRTVTPFLYGTGYRYDTACCKRGLLIGRLDYGKS